jgi:hypothetical protein
LECLRRAVARIRAKAPMATISNRKNTWRRALGPWATPKTGSANTTRTLAAICQRPHVPGSHEFAGN